MTLLLRHFHIKTEPSGGYDVLPPDHDQTPAADLARIKFYRNLIAHSKDGTIDEECYEEAWRHLYSVVDRLGDAHLKQDCDLLGRVDLNMAYKSLCEELSRNIETLREHASALESSQDQLTSDLIKQEKISRINENIIKQLIEDIQSKNKEAVCILETRMNNLKIQLDGMLDHLNTQQSAIPCYMKAKIVRQIKTWIDDEKKYVIIDAEMDAVDLLKKHSFLTVAGNAGCGKTAFIRHLALHFMAQGYEVVPVIEPKSIVEYHDETRKQVFVLDDVCGVHTVDQQKRGAWKEGYMLFFTKDDNFNKLIYKKFNSDVQPIVTKLFQNRVEFQCPLFPLQQTIGDEIQGRMKVQPTCIALAAKLGHESVVNLLLLNGSNPNKINIPSNNVAKLRTALPVVYAAMYGRLSIVRNLLQNGAHIESTGPMGCTLLIFASSYGHYDLAKFLLDKHVDINATNMFQNTALLYGSKKGHTNIVNLLLENGALTNTVCNKSSTPLIEAASGGHLEIVEKLLSCFSSVNACDNKNMNALTKAAKNGHYIIVERLIENQAAVNIPTHKSETALMIACRKGHSMVVSILIKHMHECLNNRYIIMEKDCSTLEIETRIAFSQLPYGFFSPSIAEESEEMNQALLVAYENKRIAIMKFLLDNGANVQIERCTSLSLLNAAVSKGEYEIVDLLLKNGAQVQKRANFGIPSLTLASNRGHTDIVTVLLKNNANINSKADRLTIPLTSQENIWLQQKRNKSDLNNIETDNGGTALIYASLNGSLELINSLLQDKNININSQTYMGRTALMIACGSGREDVVELLLRYHPELNIRSKLGATALDIAFMSKMESTNIVRRLIQNGATRSSRRHDLKTDMQNYNKLDKTDLSFFVNNSDVSRLCGLLYCAIKLQLQKL
ncbi:ankyrin-1-like [Mytilus trossulus]|uniref:ankyrin-1-like n=1 Tax=Mytilus trossulus TaxID=6551 RepID=UPI0030060C76